MKIYTKEELEQKKQKRVNTAEKVKFIFIVFITIGIIYNMSLIVQTILYPNKTPSFLGIKTFSIISGSMMPTINVGDIVVVKEPKIEELKANDIISFRENSEIITHRIYKIDKTDKETVFVTKGDNNLTTDGTTVKFSAIEGKVIKIIPKLGNLVFLLKNKATILCLSLVFVVIYIIDMKKNSKKLIREKKKELLNKKREE